MEVALSEYFLTLPNFHKIVTNININTYILCFTGEIESIEETLKVFSIGNNALKFQII